MNKTAIANFASANGFNTAYNGKARTFHFTNRASGKSVSRKVGKGLTQKMLSNTFGKAS